MSSVEYQKRSVDHVTRMLRYYSERFLQCLTDDRGCVYSPCYVTGISDLRLELIQAFPYCRYVDIPLLLKVEEVAIALAEMVEEMPISRRVSNRRII